jgi:hypothetical protein
MAATTGYLAALQEAGFALVVGLVSSLHLDDDDGRPLLFFRGRYLSD